MCCASPPSFDSLSNAAEPRATVVAEEGTEKLWNGDRSLAIASWENEGGHFSEFPRSRKVGAGVLEAAEFEILSASIPLITHTLCNDFANGLVGKRVNTFQHRSRVLRQQTARLAAMREVSRSARPEMAAG